MEYKIKKQYRLKGWTYSAEGYYFVTICTEKRINFFGSIENARVRLSPIGEIAKKYLEDIPKHFPLAGIDEFIIIPNHAHGIIKINNTTEICRNAPRRVPTKGKISPLQQNSLASIINHYKGKVTKECHRNGWLNFAWQTRYYDRVLRNEKELNGAREYINYNPDKWQRDKDNQAGLYI